MFLIRNASQLSVQQELADSSDEKEVEVHVISSTDSEAEPTTSPSAISMPSDIPEVLDDNHTSPTSSMSSDDLPEVLDDNSTSVIDLVCIQTKDLRGNPKPRVSPDRTGPDRNPSGVGEHF